MSDQWLVGMFLGFMLLSMAIFFNTILYWDHKERIEKDKHNQ